MLELFTVTLLYYNKRRSRIRDLITKGTIFILISGLWTEITLGTEPAKRPAFRPTSNKEKKSNSESDAERWKKLLPTLRGKVADSPNNLNARFLLAKGLYFAGKYDEALEHAKVANKEPNADTLGLIGSIQEKRGDFLEAIRAFENLTIKKPGDPGDLTILARVYQKAGKFESAVEKLRAAIKIDPLFRPARDGLVSVFEEQKNNFEARIALGDMVKIWDQDAAIFTKLCRLYTIDGFFDNGMNYCQKAVGMDNSVPENHIYLGMIHKRTNNERQGNNIIRSAAKRFPNSELTQWTAGQLADETKNWEEALNFYSRGAKADTKSVRCVLGIANSHFQLKNYAKAKEFYLKACSMDRTLRTEYAKAISLLRMQKEDKWYDVFKAGEVQCGAPGLQ